MAIDMTSYFKDRVNTSNKSTPIIEEENSKKDKSFMDIISTPGATLNDLGFRAVRGLGKGIEGIGDIALSLIGTAGDIFGSDKIENALANAAKYDVTGNLMGDVSENTRENSLLRGNYIGEMIGDTAEGIGFMLPSIAASAATGGGGTAVFMASAAGQSAEEALNEGASLGQATSYGLLSGALEGGIEYASGMLGGTNILSKGAGRNIIKEGLSGLTRSYVEEGLEEVASDIINPMIKAITYSGKYETPELSDLFKSFNVGGLTALAMGGARKATNIAMYGKDGEKALNKYNEILELNQEEYDLETKGELTKNLRDKYAERRQTLVQEFADQTQKLDKNAAKTQRVYANIGEQSATEFNSGQKLANEFTKIMKDKFGEDISVEFVDSKEFNGKYDPDNKVIYIDKNAEDPYLQVLNHEFTHTLRNSGEFNSLIDSVLNTMSEQEVVKERQRLRDEYGYTENDAVLNEEIAANYVSKNILTDLNKARRIISGNKSLGRKLLDFVTDKIKMVSPNSKEYSKMKKVQRTLESILNGKEINVETSGENVPQYSRKIKKYVANKDSAEKKFGFKVKRDIEYELYDYYNKTGEKIVDDYVIKSGSELYVVDSGIEGRNLKYGIQFGYHVDENLIDEVKEALEEDGNKGKTKRDIRKIVKDRSTASSKNGINDNISNSGKGIENAKGKSGDNTGSIHQDNGKGNQFYSRKRVIETDSHGVELTPEQQEYFKNSKVRDEDGNLLVVYHGTKWAGFTVFDARDTGNGNYRFGDNIVNFFTDNEDMASSYTDNSKTAKPFNTFQNMTIEEVNEMLSEYGEKVGDSTLRLVKGKDLRFKKSGYDPNKLYIEYDDGYGVLLSDGYVDMTDAVNNGLPELQVAFGKEESTELYDFVEDMIGNVYEGYLNIENPFVVDANGKYWNEIEDSLGKEKVEKAKQYINSLEGKETTIENVKNLADKLKYYGINARAKTLKDGSIELLAANDYYYFDKGETFIESKINDIIWGVEYSTMNGRTTNEIIQDVIKTKKYDGVIIKNVIDYAEQREEPKPNNIYISIKDSNQFKSTENLNPTENPDIRYARKRRTPPEGQMELELDFEGAEKNALRESIKKDAEKVKTKTPRTNETVVEKVKTAKEKIDEFYQNRNDYLINMQIQLTNSFAGVEARAKEFFTKQFEEEGLTGKELKTKVQEEITKLKSLENRAMKANAIANYMIKNELYDGIWKEIVDSGKANLFETYKLHRLNIKRMRYEYLDPKKEAELRKQFDEGKIDETTLNMRLEEAKEIKEKPVFGVETTAEESEKKVKLLEEENPEFKKWHEKIAAYNNKLMDMREEAGIVSKAQREFITKHYGDDYVPTYRELENGATKSGLTGNGKIGVAKGLHAAKGSDLDIQSIMLSMSEQTLGVNRQTLMNKLFLEIQRIAPDAFEEINIQRQNRNDMEGKIEPKPNEVYFYKNGQRVTYKTTDDIAAAFSVLRSNKNSIDGKQSIENSMVGKGLEKLVSLMKKYTTEYNPFFAIRNLFRDASDTFIYTKYSPNLIKRYNRALKEIRNNGEYYQLYLKNGGEGNSFFDKEYGINLTKKNALLEKITYVNEITELMPRLSEFMESIDAHYDGDLKNVPDSVADVAMLEASEVTVNFARGGTLTKKLNKYLMPYLNASVQGWCKTWNTFVHPESMRAWGMSMAKITLMSLPTLLFNEIFYDDDEEYQQLSDDVKGSYFLLKVGNNKFIRIPRGRVEAVMGDAMQRIYRTAKGEENAFEGYVENTLKNVSPVDNLTRTILSPVTDVFTNTTWYGGQIENRSMQALPLQERYDQNTSVIAKVLAKLPLGVSPKKWHYLLEQYSGILGDVVLPLTSKNKDLSGISGLTVNSLENNKYTNKFYDEMEKVEQQRNSENGTGVDKAKMRYFNKMNTKISKLYQERKAAEDKETQTAIQAMIVKLQKDTLEGAKEFEKTLKKYEYGLSVDELYDDYYRQATKECFGAEVALMDYDGRIYEKATIFNKCGINWDTFYNVYFDAQDITADYDADGDVVSGSKKTKITNYVKSLNLTATQKYMVMGLLGYKNTNGEQQVRSLLRSKGYNGEELNKIMKMCGYN